MMRKMEFYVVTTIRVTRLESLVGSFLHPTFDRDTS